MQKRRRPNLGVSKTLNMFLEDIQGEIAANTPRDDFLDDEESQGIPESIKFVINRLTKGLKARDVNLSARERERLVQVIDNSNLKPEQVYSLLFDVIDMIGLSLGLESVNNTDLDDLDNLDDLDDEDEIIDDELEADYDDEELDDIEDELEEDDELGELLGEEDLDNLDIEDL